MKLTVLKDVCIACGACQSIAPTLFEVTGDYAEALMEVIPEEKYDEANDAKEGCPVGAIVEVAE